MQPPCCAACCASLADGCCSKALLHAPHAARAANAPASGGSGARSTRSSCPLLQEASGARHAASLLVRSSRTAGQAPRPSGGAAAMCRRHRPRLLLLAHAALALAAAMACTAAGSSNSNTASNGDTWAVILSSSRYWLNYRHSANALAVYQAVRRCVGWVPTPEGCGPALWWQQHCLLTLPLLSETAAACLNLACSPTPPPLPQAGPARQPHPAHAGRPAGLLAAQCSPRPAVPVPWRALRWQQRRCCQCHLCGRRRQRPARQPAGWRCGGGLQRQGDVCRCAAARADG